MAPKESPSCLLSLWKTLWDQQVGLTQVKQVIFCISVLRRKWSPFPTALQVFPIQAPLVFKIKCARGSSSQCRIPGLGSPTWGLNPLLFGKNLWNFVYPPIYRSPTWSSGLDYMASLPLLTWFLVLYLCTDFH